MSNVSAAQPLFESQPQIPNLVCVAVDWADALIIRGQQLKVLGQMLIEQLPVEQLAVRGVDFAQDDRNDAGIFTNLDLIEFEQCLRL
ncbi:hypothetical protein AQ911_00345 [Burkholderia pseudomallei]|nr:hypothetical protein AQ911_00345 [Burkholderia pseudomallei]